jgi:hypothetical protein
MNRIIRFFRGLIEREPVAFEQSPEAIKAFDDHREKRMQELGNWQPSIGWTAYDKPTCKRVNVAARKISRARQKEAL